MTAKYIDVPLVVRLQVTCGVVDGVLDDIHPSQSIRVIFGVDALIESREHGYSPVSVIVFPV